MSAFAIVSDVHSNLEALEAVLQRIDALGVAEVVCLGDIVGYGADPGPVAALVQQRCKWTIQGNHDWGLFHELADFNPLAREALYLSRRRLAPRWYSPRRRALWRFLQALPQHMEDHGYLFFHGSPRDPVMEYVLRSDGFLEPEKLRSIFAAIDRPTFVGHTHWPGVHGADFKFRQAVEGANVFDLGSEPCIVNVGSVGQPRDGDPRAAFAVVDRGRVEIHRVSYNVRAAQAKILAAGLHPALAERLALGK